MLQNSKWSVCCCCCCCGVCVRVCVSWFCFHIYMFMYFWFYFNFHLCTKQKRTEYPRSSGVEQRISIQRGIVANIAKAWKRLQMWIKMKTAIDALSIFNTHITVVTINNNETTAKWKRTTKTALTAAAERIIVRKIPALEILRQSKNINDALIGFASHSKCMSVHKIDPYVWKIVNKQRQTKFIAKRPQNENGTARREREFEYGWSLRLL